MWRGVLSIMNSEWNECLTVGRAGFVKAVKCLLGSQGWVTRMTEGWGARGVDSCSHDKLIWNLLALEYPLIERRDRRRAWRLSHTNFVGPGSATWGPNGPLISEGTGPKRSIEGTMTGTTTIVMVHNTRLFDCSVSSRGAVCIFLHYSVSIGLYKFGRVNRGSCGAEWGELASREFLHTAVPMMV